MLGVMIYLNNRKTRIHRLFIWCYFSSSWWSLFFGLMLVQKDTHAAWVLRSIGMVGVFSLLTAVVWLATELSGLSTKLKWFLWLFLLAGVVIYPFNIRKGATSFYISHFGMSCSFTNDFWYAAYTIYSVLCAVTCVTVIIYLYRHTTFRYQKTLAIKLVIFVSITILGMIMDTILPAFGILSFPGSTLAQGFSMLFLYEAYRYIRRNSINIQNISRYIYDSVQNPILVLDHQFRIMIINSGARQFFKNTDSRSVPTENTSQVLPDHERNFSLFDGMELRTLFPVPEASLKQLKVSAQFQAQCIPNGAPCNLTINPILDHFGDVTGYLVLINDLTEHIKAMQTLEEARRQAEAANRSKSLFLSTMSHEIRTPINAVMGMSEIIVRETKEDATLEQALQIRSASHTLASIINNVLDISKIESGKMELVKQPYSVPKMLKDLKNIISLRAEKKNLELIFDIDKNTPSSLIGDEIRIRQIITNLLSNAVKYTQKGKITVTVSAEMTDSPKQVLLFVRVADTGQGIRPEQIPHLFQAYDRLDEQKVHNIEGTGLGLGIVKKLLNLMNCEIHVDSEYKKGSCFWFKLLQTVDSDIPVGSILFEETRPDLRSFISLPDACIMAVDDNPSNLVVLQGLLKTTKATFHAVTSGKDCLKLAAMKHFDLILMDHMMPEMDGIETFHRLKALEGNPCKDTIFVMVTANALDNARSQYLSEGFHDYLSKPVEPAELEKLLKKFFKK